MKSINLNIDNIPSGQNVQLHYTDEEVTKIAADYLNENLGEIKDLINRKLKVNLDVSDPIIHFEENEVQASARAGVKFIKATAKINAEVNWDGNTARVNVKTLELPVVKIDASRANGMIQKPVHDFVEQLKKDFDIQSFQIKKGNIYIDAVKR